MTRYPQNELARGIITAHQQYPRVRARAGGQFKYTVNAIETKAIKVRRR